MSEFAEPLVSGSRPDDVPPDTSPDRREAEPYPLRQLFVATVVAPGRAMRNLAVHPGRRWIVPLLLLVIFGVATAAVTTPQRMRAARTASDTALQGASSSISPEEQQRMDASVNTMLRLSGVLGLVGAGLGPIVALLIMAAAFHLVGTVLGGQQTFSQMLSSVSWARLPLVFQEGLRLVVWGLAGNYDASASGLSGLVQADSFLHPVLAEVTIWNLWTLALLAVAVREVCRVDTRKAVAAVAVLLLLRVGVAEVAIGIGRALGSVFG